MTWSTISNQVLANLISGPINQKRRENTNWWLWGRFKRPRSGFQKGGSARDGRHSRNLANWSGKARSVSGWNKSALIRRHLLCTRLHAWWKACIGSSSKSSGSTAPSNIVSQSTKSGNTHEQNMLQAMITLKKRQRVEIGLDQITGLTLAFSIGNSTLSTDSGHEYKWCPASNRIGVTSCGVTQITVLVANKPFESHARSQLRCRRHVDHDKFQLCDDQETCIHHELGRQDEICSWAIKPSLQPPRAHFLTTSPHFPGRRGRAG